MARRSLKPTLVLKIFQLRVQKKSIDEILEAMNDTVSRGTVAKYVRVFDNLPDSGKGLDLTFEWNKMEITGIPWEASEWLLKCEHANELRHVGDAADGKSILTSEDDDFVLKIDWLPFTNRWANWCWRVHQADPTLTPEITLLIAHCYSNGERMRDLLPHETQLDMRPLDALLRYRPYNSQLEYESYIEAIFGWGQIPAIFEILENLDAIEAKLANFPGSQGELQYQGSMELWMELVDWLGKRLHRRRNRNV